MSEEQPTVKKERKARTPKAPVEQKLVSRITKDSKIFDWKSLIPIRYFEINQGWLNENGIDLSKLENDSEREEIKERAGEENLFIKLAGFRYLAHLRGFSSIKYHVQNSVLGGVSSVCDINFNSCEVEHDGEIHKFDEISASGVASSNEKNTNYPFSNFPESMAENRSFIRAVKTAFNINVLGVEELEEIPAPKKDSLFGEEGTMSAQDSLIQMLGAKGQNFQDLKNSLIKQAWPEQENWNNFFDIPSKDCCEIMEKIRAKMLKN